MQMEIILLHVFLFRALITIAADDFVLTGAMTSFEWQKAANAIAKDSFIRKEIQRVTAMGLTNDFLQKMQLSESEARSLIEAVNERISSETPAKPFKVSWRIDERFTAAFVLVKKSGPLSGLVYVKPAQGQWHFLDDITILHDLYANDEARSINIKVKWTPTNYMSIFKLTQNATEEITRKIGENKINSSTPTVIISPTGEPLLFQYAEIHAPIVWSIPMLANGRFGQAYSNRVTISKP